MNFECAFEWSFVVIAKVIMDLHDTVATSIDMVCRA
jgi:hypothetical protein